MENVLEEEPVFLPQKYGGNQPKVFEQIRARALAKQKSKPPLVRRAKPVKDDEDSESDIIQNLQNGMSSTEIYSQLMKKVAEKRREKPVQDLRELINQRMQEKEIESEDSFYSIDGSFEYETVQITPSYARDLVSALGTDSMNEKHRNQIMKMILELPVKTDVRIAEALLTAPNEKKMDIFSICSLFLEEISLNSEFMLKFLQFFGNVMKTVFTQDNFFPGFRKLIEERSDTYKLYAKLIKILVEKRGGDKIFLNSVAKIVYFSTTLHKVKAIFETIKDFDIVQFVENLHRFKMKYLSMTCYRFLRHWYKLKHDLYNTSNHHKQDLAYCDWVISALKQFPNQIDCLYALYYITDKMPMTNLKAVFEVNNLETVLDKSIERFQLAENDEMELLALKVKLFIHEGNFLNGKLEREAILSNKKPMERHQKGRFNNDPDLIPLDYEPPQRATYKGILRSITELNDPEPYHCTAQDEVHVDRRLEILNEEENKIVEFTYSRLFLTSSIAKKGHLEVRVVPNTNHKYLVAAEICALLNCGTRGILLVGIAGDDEEIQVIRGVKMDRKDRDEFRIGLDNILKDLIVPEPDYQRFEAPVFNPVLGHPGDVLSDEVKHFVIRFDVKQPNLEEKGISYKMKNKIFKNKA